MNSLTDRIAPLTFRHEKIAAAVFGRAELDALPFDSDEGLRAAEKSFLSGVFGIETRSVFMLNQEHTDRIVRIAEQSVSEGIFFDTGDALYTLQPGRLLCIRTADCLPIFFFANHRDRTAAGIIHAGWRGMAQHIIRDSIMRVSKENGIPENAFHLFRGPCIGAQAYEVQSDVADHFIVKTDVGGGRFLLDLPGNALLQYPDQKEYVDSFHGCTFNENDRFYSHRRGDRRRNLNVMMIRNSV
jgi:hypothetical protein